MHVNSSFAITTVPWQGTLLRQLNSVGPLGFIILLHIALFYALQHGLMRHTPQPAVPKEVVATFITPPATRTAELPKPQPAVPQAAPRPRAAPPVVNKQPSEKAISTPPAPPVKNETAPPAPTANTSFSSPAPSAQAPAAPTAPTAPAVPAQPKTVSSGIEYIQPPQPDYPPVAKRMGEEGNTVLRVLVNDKGRPERVDVQKSSGSPRLDEAARQAVLRAIFKPFMDDGKAVPAYAIVPIRFQLDN